MGKLFNIKSRASFQIVLLIVAIFSFSYIIYGATEVSAVDLSQKCCELTKDNEPCADIADESECRDDAKLAPSKCGATSFCKLGCCIDDVEGTYDKNVAQASCQGRWEDDKNCNVAGASLGCCILGDTNAFATTRRCERLSDLHGVELNYRSDLNEAQCVALAMIQKQGACVLGGGNCKFSTEAECLGLNGNFAEDYLCTSKELNTNCEPTDKTTCVDGKDGVYFLDSCGSPANIYDASKVNDEEYWEKVVSIDDACGATSGNANSKLCGNCNRFLGGVCAGAGENNFKPDYGDFYCKDTSCKYQGKTYKNGESWCVYDGKIDDGDDVVGSRHWKYVCNQGEIQVEPCADYRNEICVQSNMKIDSHSETFSNAACRVNNWRNCLDMNSAGKDASKCAEEPDCGVKNVNLGESFNFDICTPRYPEGFGFNSGGQSSAKEICEYATRTCVVKYEKKTFGGCECVENCACEEAVFTETMNDVCRSLGDCGGHVNVVGKYSGDGCGVSGAPSLGQEYINNLIKMAEPKNFVGQFAEVGDLTKYLKAAGLLGFNDNSGTADDEEDGEDSSGLATKIGMGATGIGYAMSIASHTAAGLKFIPALKAGLGGATATSPTATTTTIFSDLGNPYSLTTYTGGFPASLAAFANAAMAVGAIVGTASLIASLIGIRVTKSGMIAGAVAGVASAVATQFAINMAAYTSGQFAGSIGLMGAKTIIDWALGDIVMFGFDPVSLGIGIAVAVLFMALFEGGLFGGDCEPKIVTFTCKPWQAPVGGADCEKCNNNLLKPCSEYQCDSLGSACELINRGSSEEMCIEGNPNDASPPQIEPQLGTIHSDAKYSDIKDKGFRITNLHEGCLDTYTPLLFGIKTNEPSQCKFDLEMKDNFEDMAFDLGSNAYVYNHTTSFVLPDPSHGQSQGIDWQGDLTLYIKCRDTHGNELPGFYTIDMCVNQGIDTTPPTIRATLPGNNALVSYNSSEKKVFIYTNELAQCRWSLEDENYDMMGNDFVCGNNLADMAALGYLCYGNLPVDSSENEFYIRCKDQVWLGNSLERNSNQESFVYVLKKPESALSIEDFVPDGEVKVSSVPATVALKVKTSGGGEYTKCSYSFTGYDNMILFFDTYSNFHEQEFNLMSGRYKVYIECEDETGDKARDEVNFKLVYDSSAPQIARVFVRSGSLIIITTEEADCRYSHKSCSYDFSSANGMGSGTEHSVAMKKGKTYYVRCKDEFGNLPSGACSIIVRSGDYGA